MARNNSSSSSSSSSWLDAVKKAFTKHISYTPKMIKPNQVHHHQMQQKKSKRRWIFKKSTETTTILHHESSDIIIPETHYEYYSTTKYNDDDAMAMAMAMAMATTEDQEDTAALVIQTLFRGYLARRALEALKGVVKLQALVRGHIVRKRANMTLKCMLRVQARLSLSDHQPSSTNQPNSIHNHIHTRKRSEEWCRMEEIQAMLQKTHLHHHQEFEHESRRCYDSSVEIDTTPRSYCKRGSQEELTYSYYQQQTNNTSPLQSSSELCRGKRNSSLPSYMSPTKSAMARTSSSPTRQRKPISYARKRLCFNGSTKNMIDDDMLFLQLQRVKRERVD